MELEIHNISGKKTSKKVKLNDDIFAIEPNDHAIYLDCKQYLANQRQGTHKTKQKHEVARTTKKAFRQKGTGGARRGSMKSPVVKGGGRAFGPQPRDYFFKLNKKVKQLARRSALAYKAIAEGIVVLEDFNFEAPKTKNYSDLLKNLNLTGKKTILVLSEPNKAVYLSARNLGNTIVTTAAELNTYEVLNSNNVLFTESSVKEIEKNLA